MNLSEIIRERRSIRKYENREVPQEVLKGILEDALWAPSGSNRQNWDIVVVRGKKKDELLELIERAGALSKPKLEKIFPEKIVNITMQFYKKLGGAPVVLLVYIPGSNVEILPEMSNPERYRKEHDRYTNLLSASALIQNILLLAKASGLGTCWMTSPKHVEDQINELVGVKEQELVSVIPIGYPDQSPPAPPRKGDKIHWIGFE